MTYTGKLIQILEQMQEAAPTNKGLRARPSGLQRWFLADLVHVQVEQLLAVTVLGLAPGFPVVDRRERHVGVDRLRAHAHAQAL